MKPINYNPKFLKLTIDVYLDQVEVLENALLTYIEAKVEAEPSTGLLEETQALTGLLGSIAKMKTRLLYEASGMDKILEDGSTKSKFTP